MGAKLEARVEQARDARDSNGLGTALYVIGLAKTPAAVDVMDAEPYFERMQQLTGPVPGCLAIAYGVHEGATKRENRIEVAHMAVVTSTHPVKVTHRPGINEELKEDDTLQSAFAGYGSFTLGYFVKR